MKQFTLYRINRLRKSHRSEGVTFQSVSGQYSTIARFMLTRGVRTAPSSHLQDQFTYVVEGTLRYIIEGRTVVAKRGDILHIAPKAIHSAEVLEDSVLLDFFTPAWPDLIST